MARAKSSNQTLLSSVMSAVDAISTALEKLDDKSRHEVVAAIIKRFSLHAVQDAKYQALTLGTAIVDKIKNIANIKSSTKVTKTKTGNSKAVKAKKAVVKTASTIKKATKLKKTASKAKAVKKPQSKKTK